MTLVDPEARNSALVIIDVQKDFALPGAPAEIAETLEAVPAMRQLLDAFRQCRRPIFHVVRLYLPDGSNVDLSRRDLVINGASIVAPGTEGAEQMDDLRVDPSLRLDTDTLLRGELQRLGSNEWAMYKPRWGAFYGTRFDEFLHSRGIDTLIVCGCNFPNCPRTTVYEASERDFRVGLVSDATSGTYPRGQDELARIGVRLFDTTECVFWLTRRSESTQTFLAN